PMSALSNRSGGSERFGRERSEATGKRLSLQPKPPRGDLNHRPNMFDEANQRQQEFDQSPSQEAEPCGHYGHDQRSEERDKQPAFCAGEREARLRLIVRLCLLMTVHWLDLVGKPMTSCDQLAKQ